MTNSKDMKKIVCGKKDFWFQQKDIENITYNIVIYFIYSENS